MGVDVGGTFTDVVRVVDVRLGKMSPAAARTVYGVDVAEDGTGGGEGGDR